MDDHHFDKACNNTSPDFQELSKADQKRRSLHDMTSKAVRNFHSMISTPNVFNKMMHQSQTYKINDTPIKTGECSSSANLDNCNKRTMHELQACTDECASLVKIPKTELIKETPSRTKNFRRSSYMKPFTNFASTVSIRRRSLRFVLKFNLLNSWH